MSIWDYFTPEAGQQRRQWLEGQAEGLLTYVPPELRPWLMIANEVNPVTSMERAGDGARRVADPNVTGWDKVRAVGDTASNMAGIVAPMVAGAKGAVPVANAVEEALTGYAPMLQPFMWDEFGGIRAFHGSPHDFDRFDMSKIGTGEGAQAYGHGLYFAENPKVAQEYKNLMPMSDPTDGGLFYARGALAETKFNTAKAIDYLLGKRKETEAASGFLVDGGASTLANIDDAIARIKAGEFKPGRMYEVQINANPDDFLDWDKPLSEQPQAARDAIISRLTGGRPLDENTMRGLSPYLSKDFGEVKDLAMGRGPMSGERAAQFAAEMKDAGIPGIRYLDAGSRGAGDGSRNYVVFDDQLISIIRKYGIAGAAALYGVSAADIEAAMAQEQPRGLLNQ